MNANATRFGYVPELNGLRGIAILSVMAFHAGLPDVQGGFIGVDIFFGLSGFLITTLLLREFDRSGTINLKNFYIRRALRLGPALIALLVVFCLWTALVAKGDHAQNYIDALIALFYVSNWARAFVIHPPDLLAHTWSLSIEEQFYLIWPTVMLLLLRVCRTRRRVALIVCVLAFAAWFCRAYLFATGTPPERIYNGLDTRADALMVGCVLSILLSCVTIDERTRKILLPGLAVLGTLALVFLGYVASHWEWHDPRLYYYGFFAIELCTALLILDVMMRNRSDVQRLLGMSWLVWIGSISYGLYLWHYPMFRILGDLGYQPWTAGWLATFCVATISYYCMERPLLRLKDRLKDAPPPHLDRAHLATTTQFGASGAGVSSG